MSKLLEKIWNFIKRKFPYKKKEITFENPTFPAFPFAMNISTRLLSMDLVSVQPLSAPTGLLFYMDFGNPNSATRKVILEKCEKFHTFDLENYQKSTFR